MAHIRLYIASIYKIPVLVIRFFNEFFYEILFGKSGHQEDYGTRNLEVNLSKNFVFIQPV
jgi:hypothetical protein